MELKGKMLLLRDKLQLLSEKLRIFINHAHPTISQLLRSKMKVHILKMRAVLILILSLNNK